METEEIYTQMMDALDGELSEAGWGELESHLRARPDLAREWHALQAVDRLLSSAPAARPAADFAERTVARLPSARQRLWVGLIVYATILASGIIPLAAIIWLAMELMPALGEPALLGSIFQAGAALFELAGVVLRALLSGAGELVAQQPAIFGWLLLMVSVVVLWISVYRRLVWQARRA